MTLQKLKEYTITSLLRSREEIGLPTLDAPEFVTCMGGAIPFSEDYVNIYLVDVLLKYATRSFDDPRFCPYRDDIARRVEENPTDTRNKFEIHKTTADIFLLLGSLFDPSGKRQYQVGRASELYGASSIYLRELRKGYTPLVLTLKRLSNRIDDYMRILGHLGTHYFSINLSISGKKHDAFMREVVLEQKTEELINLYSLWGAKKDPDTKLKIDDLERQIRDLRQGSDLKN